MRLVYGADYLGNICGASGQKNVPKSITPSEWSKRQYLWYPLTYDFKQKKLMVDEALKLGVCLDRCPPPSTISSPSTVRPYAADGAKEQPPPWIVLVNSTPNVHFRRCVPEIFTFDCQGDESCAQFILSSNSTFTAAMELGGFVNAALEEVRKYSWTIWVGIGVGLVFCFVWMCLIRFLLKPVIVATMGALLLLFIGVGYMFYQLRTDELAKPQPNEETARWHLGFACLGFIFAGMLLLFLLFYGKTLMLSIDVIEEASRVPVDIPTTIFVPPATMLWVIGFAAFAVVLAIFIQSTSENVTMTLPVPSFLNQSDPRTQRMVLNSTDGLKDVAFNSSITITDVQFPNWRPYAHTYNLFFFLWMFGLQNAICFQIIALCTVFWYFSNPGDDKRPPMGAVVRAWCITMRYHLGTLAFGSMLVAIVQTIRIIMALMEERMRRAGDMDNKMTCMFKCAQCFLACLEKCINLINKSAYIVQAITGDSFLTAARNGIEMVTEHIVAVAAISFIAEWVILIGKLMVTCSTIILSYLIMKGAGATDGITGGVLLLFIIAILTFFIVSLFANIFSVCIDTMLLCFCFDKKQPGHDYFPEDLAAYVATMAAVKRKSATDNGPKKAADGALAEPMKAPAGPGAAQPHIAPPPHDAGGVEL